MAEPDQGWRNVRLISCAGIGPGYRTRFLRGGTPTKAAHPAQPSSRTSRLGTSVPDSVDQQSRRDCWQRADVQQAARVAAATSPHCGSAADACCVHHRQAAGRRGRHAAAFRKFAGVQRRATGRSSPMVAAMRAARVYSGGGSSSRRARPTRRSCLEWRDSHLSSNFGRRSSTGELAVASLGWWRAYADDRQ